MLHSNTVRASINEYSCDTVRRETLRGVCVSASCEMCYPKKDTPILAIHIHRCAHSPTHTPHIPHTYSTPHTPPHTPYPPTHHIPHTHTRYVWWFSRLLSCHCHYVSACFVSLVRSTAKSSEIGSHLTVPVGWTCHGRRWMMVCR